MNLDHVVAEKKNGEEKFHISGNSINLNLIDFWSWSSSDILSNALRGVMAEFIVASDLDVLSGCRTEWDAYDLITSDGIKIEVKSASFLQSWAQTKLSSISFGISPTKGWDSRTNEYSTEYKRQADVYVFCLLNHKTKDTVDPMNLAQWDFYILATKTLNTEVAEQKRIGLNSLLKLNPVTCRYGNIREAIDRVLMRNT